MHQWTDSTIVADRIDLLQKNIEHLLNELRRTKLQLAGKDEELESCLRSFSHEIRAPLAAIRGFTALCREEFDEGLPSAWGDYLGRIVKNVDHLETLVDAMVRLSDLSPLHEDFVSTPVYHLVQEVAAQAQLEHREKNFTLTIDENLPALFISATLLRQIFSNLISNAVKFSRPRAPLKIHVGYVADELFHKFFVRDNGIGIHPAKKSSVFAPFVRLHKKTPADGSGLGLAIVRRLISACGGEIWVDSRLRRGSIFYFTLPRTRVRETVLRPRVIEEIEA